MGFGSQGKYNLFNFEPAHAETEIATTEPFMANRKIKLIWDFRGPEADRIAEHHAIHLKEFSEKEELACLDVGTEKIGEMYCLAYIVVKEEDMITYRDALIPHRAELAR